MSGRILLLSAEEQYRWRGVERRELVKVADDEVLLARTIRQCRVRFGGEDPLLVTHLPSLRAYSRSSITPRRRDFIGETLLTSYMLWGEQWTVVLLGNVYYSDYVFNLVVDQRDKHAYKFYGTNRDIYALTYTDKDLVYQHVSRSCDNSNNGLCAGTLWDICYSLAGLPPCGEDDLVHVFGNTDDEHFVVFGDSTCEFETVEQYRRWHKEYVGEIK